MGVPADSDYVVHDKQDVHFVLDFDQAKVSEATGKLGRGKHIEIPAHPLGPSGTGIQRTLQIEAYDDFPNVLLSSVDYKNTGTTDYQIDDAIEQQHRFNSHEVKDKQYDMWSYQGSSYDWGEEDVLKLTRSFSRPNLMGAMVKGGYGGGIPVVAFWTQSWAKLLDT